MQTYAYGFPKLGKQREFKKSVEEFWNGKISEDKLGQNIQNLEEERRKIYAQSVDKFPSNEISFYDPMLDTALLFGVYKVENLADYFELCRGKKALEMTKWFNTNYHYLVPEFKSRSPSFSLNWEKFKKLLHKTEEGIPYFIGPFTFLKLSKGIPSQKFSDYLLALTQNYKDLLKQFREVHIDEPAFVLELSSEEIKLIKKAYRQLSNLKTKINLFTYYESVDFLKDLFDLPIHALGLDFVNGKENLKNLKSIGYPKNRTLIAGVVNGRNVWRADLNKVLELLKELSKYTNNLLISNASPLYHLPISLEGEKLDNRLLRQLAFAQEKLQELKHISEIYQGKKKVPKTKPEEFGINPAVRRKIKNLKEADFKKPVPYAERAKLHKDILKLPLLPTTTIGSYPQTAEVRAKRNAFREGKISEEEYSQFIKEKILELIKLQERLGLDVLVHGEYERTDMVEFFAEKLEGIATTKAGWIISYGTRVYRPPIIYGDISRPKPMTIREIAYAQSLTQKPVKGMLTGPVTIIAWSFVRDDIPIWEVAYQIALCLQEEIKDYEKHGIKIVQIDEPAIREKAPLKKKDWKDYFEWAIKSFSLASRSKPETQIHTHMCYSEFGEIIDQIVNMDFDVISIETSRSRGDILKYFEKVNFTKQIGLGVWDIHSPVVPKTKEIQKIIERALRVIPKENFWINPDCGLKTRNWEEVIPSLKNMVEAAKKFR